MTVKGWKKHSSRIKAMANVSAREIAQKLYLAGQEIELEAEHSITAGSISGAGHIPSLPGEPPNRDTGLLDGSIDTEIVAQNPPTVIVASRAPYAAHLEFGTSKMAARPYMRPATEKKRKRVAQLVGEAVSIAIKRG